MRPSIRPARNAAVADRPYDFGLGSCPAHWCILNYAKVTKNLLKLFGFFIILVTLQIKNHDMLDVKNISAYRESLKEKILAVAMSAFFEKGVKAVKMDDIANSLSISKRTLYEIYKNKEDLLFEGIKRHKQTKKENLRMYAAGSTNVMDFILHSFKLTIAEIRSTDPTFYSDLLKYPKILKYFEEETKNTQDEFFAFLNRGIEEGYFLANINYDLVTSLLDAQYRHVMMAQLYKKYTMEEICNNLIYVSLRGICTIKGIRVLDASLLADKQ